MWTIFKTTWFSETTFGSERVNLYTVFRFTQNLLYTHQKAYFDVKKQLQFERGQKLWKEVKDDTAKYEETITELKRKGQIRKSKQISR